MKPKLKDHGAASVLMEQTPGGLYLVLLRTGSSVADKIRCDTYREALAWWKAFNTQARAYKGA